MKLLQLSFFLALLGSVCSLVLVNSNDHVAVSSAIFYANFIGDDIDLIYPGTDSISKLREIGSGKNVLLIEPSGNAQIPSLRQSLESNGNSVETLTAGGNELNMLLATRSQAKNFVVIDPAQGPNIVSVISYAKTANSYVLFANSSNAERIGRFVAASSPGKILLYGYTDESISAALEDSGVAYESIHNGDRYEDNIQLLERYFSLNPNQKNIVLCDGTFLENSVNSGDFPVVLISSTIPASTYSFLLQKTRAGTVSSGVLIGPENINSVYDMMKRINNELGGKQFSVFVKFGQTTAQSGEPDPLSKFPLPSPFAAVSLASVSYNPLTETFELVFRNNGNTPAYVRSTVAVLLEGQQVGTFGDEVPYWIKVGESKGMRYPFANPGEGQLAINDTTYYGISKYSFDKAFIKYMDVGRISFVDGSSVAIPEASYSPLEDKLTLRVRNNGSVDAFYRLTVAYVNDEGLTIYEEESVRGIAAGRNDIVTLTGVIQLPQEKADSTQMNVTAAYGAREAFLDKEATATVKLESFPLWILLLLLLLLLLIAYWYYRRRKGEKAEKKK